ncbi:hypothetical protein PROFUN_13245, partial [Planoprotostelium fungivorum]
MSGKVAEFTKSSSTKSSRDVSMKTDRDEHKSLNDRRIIHGQQLPRTSPFHSGSGYDEVRRLLSAIQNSYGVIRCLVETLVRRFDNSYSREITERLNEGGVLSVGKGQNECKRSSGGQGGRLSVGDKDVLCWVSYLLVKSLTHRTPLGEEVDGKHEMQSPCYHTYKLRKHLAPVPALQMRRLMIHTYRRCCVVSLSPLRVDTTGTESISDASSHKCRPLASNAFVAAVLQTNTKAKMLELNVYTVFLFFNCLLFCWRFVVVLREEVKEPDQTATPRRKVSKASTRREKAFKKCSEELRKAQERIKREKRVGCRLHKELLEVKERSETDLKSHLVESYELRAEVALIRQEKEQVVSEHEARAAALTSLTERLQTNSGLQSALKKRSLEAETQCREREGLLKVVSGLQKDSETASEKHAEEIAHHKREIERLQKTAELLGLQTEELEKEVSTLQRESSRSLAEAECKEREGLLKVMPPQMTRMTQTQVISGLQKDSETASKNHAEEIVNHKRQIEKLQKEVSELQEKYEEESSKRSTEADDHKKEKEKLSQEISQLTAEASVRSSQTAKLEKDLSEMQVKHSSEHLKRFKQATDHRKAIGKIRQELSKVKSQSAKRCTELLTENRTLRARHEAAERTITDLRAAAVVAELQSLSLTDGPRFPMCTRQHQPPSAPVVDTSVSTPVQTDPTADMDAEVTNTAVSTPPQIDPPVDMEAEVTDTAVYTPTQTDTLVDMEAEVANTAVSTPPQTDAPVDMEDEVTDTA